MYESPIEYVTSELTKQLEGDVLTLAQSYGVRVDKDELIRALNYDRQQYEKALPTARRLRGTGSRVLRDFRKEMRRYLPI